MSDKVAAALIAGAALVIATLIPALARAADKRSKRKAAEPNLAGISHDIISALYKQIAYLEAQVEDMRRDLIASRDAEDALYKTQRAKETLIRRLERKIVKLEETIVTLREYVEAHDIDIPTNLIGEVE